MQTRLTRSAEPATPASFGYALHGTMSTLVKPQWPLRAKRAAWWHRPGVVVAVLLAVCTAVALSSAVVALTRQTGTRPAAAAAPAVAQGGFGSAHALTLRCSPISAPLPANASFSDRLRGAAGALPAALSATCTYGTVTAASATALTVRTLDGHLSAVATATTLYYRGTQQARRSDVHVGDVVGIRPVMPLFNPAGQVTAQSVTVQTQAVFGTVRSVAGSTVTIVTVTGKTIAVTASMSTKYVTGGSLTTAGGVKPGAEILAQGQPAGSTKLTADTIDIAR